MHAGGRRTRPWGADQAGFYEIRAYAGLYSSTKHAAAFKNGRLCKHNPTLIIRLADS